VWAIGVITYILLAGYPPFYIQNNSQEENGKSGEDNDEALLKKIVNGEYEFIEATWKNISPEAVQFIKR
jgi:serine/threonine protein kinase